MLPSRKVVDARDVVWDDTYDVVVVGAGAAGFPAALNASRHGASVAILEKAAEPGGTMKKSAAWYWIPNNRYMREDGKPDDKEGFLRYCARLARPQAFTNGDHYGLSDWEYETISALYDNASIANDALAEMGAIKPLYSPAIPDYHSAIPEAAAPYGRTLQIDRGDGEMGKGDVLTAQLLAACERLDVPVRYEHRVEGVVVDGGGAVVGVRASSAGGERLFGARQAVIFASGGFTPADDAAAARARQLRQPRLRRLPRDPRRHARRARDGDRRSAREPRLRDGRVQARPVVPREPAEVGRALQRAGGEGARRGLPPRR